MRKSKISEPCRSGTTESIMQELLFLLLPVAALSGWLIARLRQGKPANSKNSCAYEPNYYKGLNFLLNEQPDKAIDVFVQLLEVDSETVETHLALGSLFRKRGEVDRAIRIHQNLIARPSLAQEQRAHALLELGQDYLYAGLHDRAENLFNELVDSSRLQKKALENLREIYQQEKVWDKCLNVVFKLQNLGDGHYSNEISHYYCELAEEARKRSDKKLHQEYIRKAKQAAPDSIRALTMEAGLEVENKNYRKAVSIYERIIEHKPAFIGEVLENLLYCYTQNGVSAELESILKNLYQKTGSSLVLQRLIGHMLQSHNRQQVEDYLLDLLRDASSLQSLQLLIKIEQQRPAAEMQRIFEVIGEALEHELGKRPAYSCQRCGFAAKTLYWQCPGCKGWGTLSPLNEHDRICMPVKDIKKV